MKSLKDTLVVTGIGAEAISFIKIYFVLPVAVLFTILYFKLSNLYSFDKLFTIITLCFIVFFLIFAFGIFPRQDYFHMSTEATEATILRLPNLKWTIKILAKWSYIITYILAELWSAVVVNLLFWQLANQILDTKQATRIYLFLAMIGNLGLILAGTCLKTFANPDNISLNILDNLNLVSTDNMEITLKLVTLVITFSSMLTLSLLYYLKMATNRRNKLHSIAPDATITKLTLKESFKIILKSDYIICIATIVLCYSLAINLVEGAWKAKIVQLYQSNNEYIDFMGNFNIATGLTCVLFTIIGTLILNRFGWLWAALISPIDLGCSGFLFFVCIFGINSYGAEKSLLLVTILIGGWQNIFSKAAKYSIFDATKEMSYIPLSVELKTKGKAAVDVSGSKLGKSLGAILQAGMFTIFPNATFNSITPVLFLLFCCVVILWIRAIKKLGEKYNNMLLLDEKEPLHEND
jgi:ADP/ATP carrier protein family